MLINYTMNRNKITFKNINKIIKLLLEVKIL